MSVVDGIVVEAASGPSFQGALELRRALLWMIWVGIVIANTNHERMHGLLLAVLENVLITSILFIT